MTKQILKQVTIMMILIAFTGPTWASEEDSEQRLMTQETAKEYRDSELEEASMALNNRGLNLFEYEEGEKNCQLQILSQYTVVAWIMKPRFLKKIKLRGQLVTYTFERVECTGTECFKFLVKGFIDLNSGEKKVEEVQADKKLPSHVINRRAMDGNSANSDSEIQEELKKKPIFPAKPINTVKPLVNIVNVDHDYRIQVICKDEDKQPITKD